jgi:hypothetical protein
MSIQELIQLTRKIEELEADNQRLREALEKLAPFHPQVFAANGKEVCFFCRVEIGGSLGHSIHSPDCAWVLARAALTPAGREKENG